MGGMNPLTNYGTLGKKKARKGTTLRLFYAECFLTSNIFWKITIETKQYTKYTRLRKSTNPHLQKDYVHLNWKDILLVVEVLPWLSPRWLVLQKNHTVWHFGLSRNPGNEFARQFTKQHMWYIAYLYENYFCFKKKFLPPLDPVFFFRNIFTPGTGDVLWNWHFFSNATTLQSRLSESSKHGLPEKCFIWVFCNSWKFARKRSIIKSFD